MSQSRISYVATEKLPGWGILRTGEHKDSSFSKSQVLAWMISNSSKKNSNLLENCQKLAHKLS